MHSKLKQRHMHRLRYDVVYWGIFLANAVMNINKSNRCLQHRLGKEAN